MTHEQVVSLIRGRIKALGTQRAAAASLHVSTVYLGDILKGRRSAGPKILRAFGIVREETFRRVSQ